MSRNQCGGSLFCGRCWWPVCVSVFQARELSESLGIPLSCVLPVKNYSGELDLDQDTDILLFSAVEQMLNYADNFFENQEVNDDLELYRSIDGPRPVFSEQTCEHRFVWKNISLSKTSLPQNKEWTDQIYTHKGLVISKELFLFTTSATTDKCLTDVWSSLTLFTFLSSPDGVKIMWCDQKHQKC